MVKHEGEESCREAKQAIRKEDGGHCFSHGGTSLVNSIWLEHHVFTPGLLLHTTVRDGHQQVTEEVE